MTKTTTHPALVALDEFGGRYPGIWEYVDALRARECFEIDSLPSWCFLTIGASEFLMQLLRQETDLSIAGYGDSMSLNALAAWRVTKGIYSFDPLVFDAVVNSPVTGVLPFEVLCRLPEWCVYVETPNLSFQGQSIEGIWAHLEWDAQMQGSSLHITAPSTTNVNHIRIALNSCTLQQAVSHGIHFDGNGIENRLNTARLCAEIEPFVSLLLYVCSQTSEIGDGRTRPKNPEPKIVRKVPRLFQAERLTRWDVGIRMGATLRISGVTSSAVSSGSRGSPRPHIRRAHWQGFRSGPRTDSQGCLIPISARDLCVKWLPPMLINEPVGGVQMLPATVRAVI